MVHSADELAKSPAARAQTVATTTTEVSGRLAKRSFARRVGAGTLFAAVVMTASVGCSDTSNETGTPKAVVRAPVSADNYIANEQEPGSFALVAKGAPPTIVVNANDYPGVLRAVRDVQRDIESVTHVAPTVVKDKAPYEAKTAVLVGTIGKNPLIDDLSLAGKLDLSEIRSKWETYLIQVVDKPMEGLDQALVIAGSDQRGTIYGLYDLSKRIGVSPWHWWDDIPPKQQAALYVRPGRYGQGTPAVKYRGIFINDENPQTGTWAPRLFGPGLAPGYTGGMNHYYFEKVFELMLRLKANYLWPLVWGRAFAEDDPENHATAKRYGIVMGTSHEAPMMRGIEEWNRHVIKDDTGNPIGDPYGGNGKWGFSTNPDALKAYWRDGAKRMLEGDFEGVFTVGMRGTGDSAMDGTGKKDLMASIVKAEREVLADVMKKPIEQIPQVFTLYKEVQQYYDEGMPIPDDVTIVYCDDNWGNMRKYPDLTKPKRAGGYGIYYHFDYVGVGRNYKWADSTLLPNMHEQLELAINYGVDRLWVVNVGDMKGNEVPLEFFMDYAWSPDRLPAGNIPTWEEQWAAEQFNPDVAKTIAGIVHDYAQLQSDRKPELTNRRIWVEASALPAPPPADKPEAAPDYTACTEPDPTNSVCIAYSDDSWSTNVKNAHREVDPEDPRKTVPQYTDANPFSLTNYQELERVTRAWQELAARAEAAGQLLSKEQQDAYFELVLYEAKASAHLYALRLAQFKNILYADQGRASTNDMAAEAEAHFNAGLALADRYNFDIAGGKWWGWQTQPYVGYGDSDRPNNFIPAQYYNYDADIYQWQQPEADNKALPDEIYPHLRTLAPVTDGAKFGVAIDGSNQFWPSEAPAPVLPTFSQYQTQPGQYIELFSRGSDKIHYKIEQIDPNTGTACKDLQGWPCFLFSQTEGDLDSATKEVRINVAIDWPRAALILPSGVSAQTIKITLTEVSQAEAKPTVVDVTANVDNTAVPWLANQFIEANGFVSMEADHFSRAVKDKATSWRRLADIGRTGAGMTPVPSNAATQNPGGSTPHLAYDFYLVKDADAQVLAYLSPRNNVLYTEGLRYAVSIDDGAPQTINIVQGADDRGMNRVWAMHTSDNINLTRTAHGNLKAGPHTLKFWMVDPTVIVQKLVVDVGGVKESYFGPPESYRTAIR